MHAFLQRQLKRSRLAPDAPPSTPEAWAAFLERVGSYYRESDEERLLQQRSTEIASAEMQALNTSLRASESSLQAERDRLAALMASLGDGLFALTPEGRCTLLNREATRLLGWTAEDLLGVDVLALVEDGLSQEQPLRERLLAIVTSGATEPLRQEDGRFRCKDGSVLPVAWTLTPVLHEGATGGAVLIFRDITERRRLQEAVERERAQLRSIITHAPIAIAMLDRDMRYVTHSSKWLTDYGLQGQELAGRSHYEVLPDIPERWKAIHRRCLAGERLSQPEDVFQRADGSSVHLRWAIHPWHAPDGAVGGLVVVSDRIDDLVRAREAAFENARLKADFLATMSHEIRTPMNGVMGMTSLLLETPLTSEQREFAQSIQLSADNLLTVINDILDFSKIEAGKLDIEVVEFQPRQVVDSVLDLLAEYANRKGLELAALVDPDVPAVVCGDPVRVRQVLTNLVSNALKFTASGEVVVSVRMPARADAALQLAFEVRDTGIGMSAEVQQRLFQPFSQGDSSTTRRYGGTGLGLVICRRLVELMGGEVGMQSVPGLGSTFSFTLAVTPAGAVLQPDATAQALRGLAVLVVDDNATNRRILELRARAWGMEPVVAEGGCRALEILRESALAGRRFDVAIVDMCMPDMDGVTLAAAVRADAAIASTPMILLSSITLREQAKVARDAGFAANLSKPVGEARLLRCLVQVCRPTAAPGEDRGQAAAAPSTPEATTAMTSAATPQAPEPVTPPAPPVDALLPRLRVLLVEDNTVNQRVARGILVKAGYDVEIRADGRAALEAIEVGGFSIVLMDCQMPVMDGFEATRVLREREAGTGRRLPVVALTADAMTGVRERCLQAGMDDYVSKPFRSTDLLPAVARWALQSAPA